MPQTVLSAGALRRRLNNVLDEDPGNRVMLAPSTLNWRRRSNPAAPGPCRSDPVANAAGMPADNTSQFGSRMDEVRVIVPHEIDGWGARNLAERFVFRYATNNAHDHDPGPPPRDTCRWGIGPQFYISSDGTAFRLIEMEPSPRLTFHAGFANSWTIGIETGHNNGGQAGDTDTHPPTSNWRALSGNASLNVDDILGLKAWVRDHNDDPNGTGDANLREAVIGWWTTPRYAGPWREPQVGSIMLFSEEEYDTWALLARYLAEAYLVPRNFPLLPHAKRADEINSFAKFRRIVLADQQFDVLVRAFQPQNITAPDLTNNIDTHYRNAATQPQNQARQNLAWQTLVKQYRGLYGHAFSGSTDPQATDHDCPGPMFDWHRFARQAWDWWWFPFDFNAALTGTAPPQRAYRNADGSTELLEYYWDSLSPPPPQPQVRPDQPYRGRVRVGIHAEASSPETFELDADSPLYALANGQIIAARYPVNGGGVSLAFLLVRHEVYHQQVTILPGFFPLSPNNPLAHVDPGTVRDRINYDAEPTSVYSLYMHLGNPADFNFNEVRNANPDWLNRILKRKRECDLGVAFFTRDSALPNPTISRAAWASRPPGGAWRPTTLERWQRDAVALQAFLDSLRNGGVALASDPLITPLPVILGDYLGPAGIIRMQAGTATHGVRVEVFSPSAPPGSAFSTVAGATELHNPPAGLAHDPVARYASEWANTPDSSKRAALQALGADPNLVTWWPEAAASMAVQTLPPNARLPPDGNVYHYRPTDYLRWINGVTWASEWPKYRVADPPPGTFVVRPDRPKSRRV